MLMIGICGASGSGKSTLADELARRLDEPCVLLKQDSYYKDHPDMDFAQRERINYDEPQAFEHGELRADLEALRAGKPITRKGYDYKQHRRCDSNELIYPADVVLLEGIHVFYDPAVRDLLDFKIFIQVDPDICLLRRVQRDIVERARHVDSVARQYLERSSPCSSATSATMWNTPTSSSPAAAKTPASSIYWRSTSIPAWSGQRHKKRPGSTPLPSRFAFLR